MQEPLHKTLIIRFSSVGDIVLSSLLVRVLRERFPQIGIDYLVKDEFADLVQYSPHLTRVLEFPGNGSFSDLRELRRRIAASGYDLVIDIHDSLRSRSLCAGLKRVVRVRKRKLARFLLVRFKRNVYQLFGGAPSVAQRYLEPLRPFGIMNDNKGLEIHFPAVTAERSSAALRNAGIPDGTSVIGICPSAKHNTKMWLKERFAEAAATLATSAKAPVVLFGSSDEHQRCAEIKAMMEEKKPEFQIANMAGKFSLLETAAAMDRCSLVITNDSGLMHIAAARRRKVLAIFGSTVKEFGFFPFGTESVVVENESITCRPCTHIGLPACPKGHFKCMNDIPTSRVVEAALPFLGQ